MNEENTNLPPQPFIPDFLPGDEWAEVDISQDLLDFGKSYRPPRYTLERGGVPFADVGELHIITGKPGHGKTGLMSQLMSALLSGRHGQTIRRTVAHKVVNPMTGEKEEKIVPDMLLYIDTEQGEDDTIAIKNRVCAMAGIDYTQPNKHFAILRLRDTEEAIDRWRKILKAIYLLRPTDIFLDGMLDIVRDYNDQMECQPIVRKCMMLATHYDASLWAVLHENPLVDKLVGTIGSITQRKVAEIFSVIKVKQSDLKPNERKPELPEIYFRVKQLKARGRDVGNWAFYYDPNAEGGWGQPIELELPAEVAKPMPIPVSEADRKRQELLEQARSLFREYPWTHLGATYTELEKYLRSKGIRSNRRIASIFDIAKEMKIILTSGNKYVLNHLQGVVPNDDADDLPFPPTDDDETPF